jgi:hypothetical protein
MHFFSSNFDKELYMFRTHLMSIIRSLNIVYTAIGICHTSYVDCLLATASRQCFVYSVETPDDGQ